MFVLRKKKAREIDETRERERERERERRRGSEGERNKKRGKKVWLAIDAAVFTLNATSLFASSLLLALIIRFFPSFSLKLP